MVGVVVSELMGMVVVAVVVGPVVGKAMDLMVVGVVSNGMCIGIAL